MRITNQMQLTEALATEARGSARIYDLTATASTGLRINKPSDDPAGYAKVVDLNSQISILQSRSSAASMAAGDLGTADGVLSSAVNIFVQAKQVALTAANGTQDAGSRADAATQVNGLISQLVALANTKGSQGYLFGGTATASPPFDANGNFVGNDGTTEIAIADGVTTQGNASGAKAFTAAGGSDVIADLKALATALSQNDVSGITAASAQMDADHAQVVAAQVDTGVAAGRLQSAGDVISNTVTALTSTLSSVQSADVASAYSSLAQAQTSYQQALAVTRQVLSMVSFGGGGQGG